MPEIDTEMIDEVESPTVGTHYTIQDVEEFESQVRNFKGYRVTLTDADNKSVVETLWKQKVAGPNSKIGAYITALGKNYDDWKGKKIRYVNWVRGNRTVEVLT